MKKIILAVLFVVLPAAMALAQPPAASTQAPKAKPVVTASSKVVGGKIALADPKLNLLPTLEYMRQVINPHANAYWEQAGSLDDEVGTSITGAPENDFQWQDQLMRAATLMEAGNGLITAGRDRDGACRENPNASCDAVWNYYAQELIDGGAAGMAASRAKNAKAAFDAGSLMYDACFGCHARYIQRAANSRYTAPFPSDDEIRAKGRELGQ